MNDRQLRYALAVWRAGSFSAAAENLNISQPSVSEQVRLLEDELGFPLFERTGHGIEVTYPGRTFLHQAEQAISDFLQLADTARQLRGGRAGVVGIGISTALARLAIPRLMRCLEKLDPLPRLEVTTAPTRRVQRLVFQGRLDVGITLEAGERSVPPGVVQERIDTVPLGVLLPRGHALAQGGNGVTIEQLGNEPLIHNEPDIGYGEVVASLFSRRGLRPAIAATADNAEAVRLMVEAGVGVAIVPVDSAAPEVGDGRLAIRPLDPPVAAPAVLVVGTGPREPRVDVLLELIRADLAAAPLDQA